MIKIASLQYKLEQLDWTSYKTKIRSLINTVIRENVKLILLPEYAGTELGGNFDNDAELYEAIQPILPNFIEFYKKISTEYMIHLLPGTIPVKISNNRYVNRAYFFGPNGHFGHQDKLNLTQFEKHSNLFTKGNNQTIFSTIFGKIGIAICYDSEFPEAVRQLIRAGAWLILVPSYTTSLAGYYRVKLSCRARAIENQCYMATSYSVQGSKLGCKRKEKTIGRAAIFSPIDHGFPSNGIIAEGKLDKKEIVYAEINQENIKNVRLHGDVHNFNDFIKETRTHTLDEVYI